MNRAPMRLAALIIVTASAAVTPAHADVVNGGFESGTFAGWTQTGDPGFSGVDAFAARTGSYGAFFGPELVGGISQSFATLAGVPHLVEFALSLTSSNLPNSFSWAWNGVTQGSPSLTDVAGFGYTNFSALVTPAGATSSLAFTFRNPQSFWLLDNVSVTPIPEPPMVVLLGAGLLLVVRKLKRRATSLA